MEIVLFKCINEESAAIISNNCSPVSSEPVSYRIIFLVTASCCTSHYNNDFDQLTNEEGNLMY